MNNSTINIDKLRLTLYYSNAVNLKYYLRKSNNHISTTLIKALDKDKDKYKYTYAFSFKGIQIGILNVGMILKDSISHLSMNNHIFYTHQSLFNEFLMALNKIDIDVEVSGLEIALDSDFDAYVKNYNRLKKSNKLVLGKNYVNRNFSEDFRNNKFIKNASVTQYVETRNKAKKAYLRFENKTLEILNSDKPKNYITDYHSRMGLDTTKDIHRFELVIPFTKCLDKGVEVIYVSKYDTSKSITKYEFDKLTKALGDIELKAKDNIVFDSNALKFKNKLDEYVIKKNVKTRYDIDITKLCNPQYLEIIFSTFGKSIIENLKTVLGNNIYTKETLKTKKLNMQTKEMVHTKIVVDNKIVIADALSDEMGISFDDALRRASEFINASNKYKIDIQDMDNLFESI